MTKNMIPWCSSFRSEDKTQHITENMKNISELGYFKKKRAKKAICWLLSKAPHTVDEIADHFEISPELVKDLIEELSEVNLVVKIPGRTTKYYA